MNATSTNNGPRVPNTTGQVYFTYRQQFGEQLARGVELEFGEWAEFERTSMDINQLFICIGQTDRGTGVTRLGKLFNIVTGITQTNKGRSNKHIIGKQKR